MKKSKDKNTRFQLPGSLVANSYKHSSFWDIKKSNEINGLKESIVNV
jgi:hypothetical protein